MGTIDRRGFSHWGMPPHWSDAPAYGRWAEGAKAFLLDIRGTGRLTYFDDLFKNAAAATNAGNSGMANWMGTAHLGWEF